MSQSIDCRNTHQVPAKICHIFPDSKSTVKPLCLRMGHILYTYMQLQSQSLRWAKSPGDIDDIDRSAHKMAVNGCLPLTGALILTLAETS